MRAWALALVLPLGATSAAGAQPLDVVVGEPGAGSATSSGPEAPSDAPAPTPTPEAADTGVAAAIVTAEPEAAADAAPAVVTAEPEAVADAAPAAAPSTDASSGSAVSVRGPDGLSLHRLRRAVPTEIPSITIELWDPICTVPCAFAPDAEPHFYGVARDGDDTPARIEGPALSLRSGSMEISYVDRSSERAAGVTLAIVGPIVGLLLTMLPIFIHPGGPGGEAFSATTISLGSAIALGTTIGGVALAYWGDGARATLDE